MSNYQIYQGSPSQFSCFLCSLSEGTGFDIEDLHLNQFKNNWCHSRFGPFCLCRTGIDSLHWSYAPFHCCCGWFLSPNDLSGHQLACTALKHLLVNHCHYFSLHSSHLSWGSLKSLVTYPYLFRIASHADQSTTSPIYYPFSFTLRSHANFGWCD